GCGHKTRAMDLRRGIRGKLRKYCGFKAGERVDARVSQADPHTINEDQEYARHVSIADCRLRIADFGLTGKRSREAQSAICNRYFGFSVFRWGPISPVFFMS